MVKSFIRNLFNPKALVTAALSLAAVSALGVGLLLNNSKVAALPTDCDNNAIVNCGFQDAQGFKDDFNANLTGDLDEIYKHFDFTSDEMSRFMSSAKWAWANRDGTIVLDDGRVVATNAWSIGRQSFGKPSRHPVTIAGKTYYWSYAADSFASGTQRIRTIVMMDKNDKYMEFAVITSCGNPTMGEKPVFQCNELRKEKIDNDTYKFWTDVSLKNATVKNLRYEFSDGTVVNETDPNKKVFHDFAPGSHTVKVTVTYIVNGKEQSETLQSKCKTEIEVEEKKVAEAVCTSLKAVALGERKYRFVGTVEYKNATVKSNSFDFGDNTSGTGTVKVINSEKAEITSADHEYAEFTGKKFIVLTVEFTVDQDKTKTVTCKTEIAREILNECIPKEGEDSNCKPICVPQKGEDSNCAKLPETGPAEVLGAAAGISGLGAAGTYYWNSRRNLRDLVNRFKR